MDVVWRRDADYFVFHHPVLLLSERGYSVKTTYFVVLRIYKHCGTVFNRTPVLFYLDHYGELVCYDEKESHSAAARAFYYQNTRAPTSAEEITKTNQLFDRYIKADIANNGDDRTTFVEFKKTHRLKLPIRHKEPNK